MSKLRARYSKVGKVRFTSHRDVARMWERAIRRVQLPIAYSEGFSPRPKLHFGLALSTGHESLSEFIDLDLRHDVEVDELPTALTAALPVGITCEVVALRPQGATSLQQAVTSCSWQIDCDGLDPGTAAQAAQRLLEAAELPVVIERKGKQVTDDLRPQLIALETGDHPPRGSQLLVELGTHPRSVRPSELLHALAGVIPQGSVDVDGLVSGGRVLRTHQWILSDGARHEPLAAPSAAALSAHAQARAS